MKGTCSSTSSSLLLRNRRVENLEMSCFGSSKTSVSSVFNGGKSAEIERDYRNGDGCSSSFDDSRDGWADGDGWGAVVVSIVRIVTCFVTMMFTTFFWGVLMVLLLPWPYARIRQGNVYGHVTGRLLMWILGNPIKIEGAEFSNTRGIYICNHASPLDIFLIMWLTPTGTVGIAKKEIIYYPLFGQLYVLANHLRIDRSNPVAAIESMKEVARAIVKKNLSLVLFPEGTRSKTGRLLPFKKGFVHIALQSRLPIVPIVLTGTHLAWRKNSLHVRPAPLTVKFLPPIKTNDWMAENIDDHVKMVYDLFIKNLPERQRPVMVEELDDSSRKKPS